MKNTASMEHNEGTLQKEIEISLNERFPIALKVKDNSNNIIDTYRIVKTKSDKFMLQK